MIILKRKLDLARRISHIRQNGSNIAFVPTMGALHEGHLSLIREAGKTGGHVVCSIFVNPTQFNDRRDFDHYPITLEQDMALLAGAGVSISFLPGIDELYPGGTESLESYPLGFLETVFEGKYRPGHFQGVCQVVHRLLEAVQPNILVMGQKDYQQCMVIGSLLSFLNSPVRMLIAPTVREADGLAMSSRNRRLTADQRRDATGIYRALFYLKQRLHSGQLSELLAAGRQILVKHRFRVDYLELADARTLEPVQHWDGEQPLVALAAAYQGEVRLIDNMLMP